MVWRNRKVHIRQSTGCASLAAMSDISAVLAVNLSRPPSATCISVFNEQLVTHTVD